MLKQQLESKEANLENILEAMVPLFLAQGYEPEQVEANAEKAIFKTPRCPLNEGFEEAGASGAEFCKRMAQPMLIGILKAMNPKLQYKCLKLRESADDYCLEQVSIE